MKLLKNSTITKGQEIYKYRLSGRGHNSKYVRAIRINEIGALEYAVLLKYATKENSAPRGGKLGMYYKIIKEFDFNKMNYDYQIYKKRRDLLRAI